MNKIKDDILILEEEALDQEQKTVMAMNPQKFSLWLFIVSIIMIFAAFTSAYIVKKADSGASWIVIDMPFLFWVNTFVLVASSVTMHWAVKFAKKDNIKMLKIAISITAVLGFGFLVGQYIAWNQLMEEGILFAGHHVASSFLYVLTGTHAVHIISGLIFLLIAVISAFLYKVHSKRLTRIQMCATYWHFLDILWLYLFAFLLFNNYY